MEGWLMASDDLKHLVAREIASGETIADVARRHGYTWKGMKKLVETAEVRALINAERHSIGELGERCRARLFQLAPEALDNIAEVLRNRKHPKRLETSRFVIEKILPARAMLQAEVSIDGSVRDPETQALLDNALIQIANSLQQLKEANANRQPLSRVLSGAEAMARRALPARTSQQSLPATTSQRSPGGDGLPILPTEEP